MKTDMDYIQAFHLSGEDGAILDAAFGQYGFYIELPHRYLSDAELTSIIDELGRIRSAYRREMAGHHLQARMSILEVLPASRDEALTIKELSSRTGISRRTLDKALILMIAAKEVRHHCQRDRRGCPIVYWKGEEKKVNKNVLRFPRVAS